MQFLKALLCIFLSLQASAINVVLAQDQRTSGHVYLSKQLQELQADASRNPISLWQERGQALWQGQCKNCHGEIAALKRSAATFPRLGADGKSLINLEDQILQCQSKSSKQTLAGTSVPPAPVPNTTESDDILSLSAALHTAAKNEPIGVFAPSSTPFASIQWQTRLKSGETLYQTRIGRMNLACMHCHDQKVGAQMRADTISQGHPTGFPIYRMSWQSMGSVDRRLRACYSGVQAAIPPAGSVDLRDLELYMKVRANGMPLDGPSIRR